MSQINTNTPMAYGDGAVSSIKMVIRDVHDAVRYSGLEPSFGNKNNGRVVRLHEDQ